MRVGMWKGKGVGNDGLKMRVHWGTMVPWATERTIGNRLLIGLSAGADCGAQCAWVTIS